MVEINTRDPNQPKATWEGEVKQQLNPTHGIVLQFIVDNNEGVMPDVPQSEYGSAVMNLPIVNHQLMETEDDKQQIGLINNIMIDDIEKAIPAKDSKNVRAHQTQWLYYKESEAINWAKDIAISFLSRVIDLNHWMLLPVDGWGLRYDKGDHAKEHAHWPHSWAWIYYASACPESAPLEIYADPDPAVNKTLQLAKEMDTTGQKIPDTIQYERHTIEPEPGRLIIIPGWVQHEVKPHESDYPRYAAAGNIAMVRAGGPKGPTMNFDSYVAGKELH